MAKESNFSLILSSPSGAGKTTIAHKLNKTFSQFAISISFTTRQPREGEINGKDYFFITKKEFASKIKDNEFYEFANIFGNMYGSSKSFVKELQEKGKNILFDIDWQGSSQLDKYKDLNLIKIFILPPNKKELLKRLNLRKKDKTKIINERISSYENDITHWKQYDYIFINDDLEVCFEQIKNLVKGLIRI